MRSAEVQSSEYGVADPYAQEYLTRSAGLTITEDTANQYDSILSEYVAYLHHEDTSVLEAKFEEVYRFLEECVRHGNRRNTLEGKLSTIAELYRYIRLRTDAGDDLVLDPIEFRGVDLSRYNVPDQIGREALTRNEILKLFDSFDSYRNRQMVIVGIETGIRNSDIRELQICDVDFEKSELHIPNPKNSKPYDIPISEELCFELDFWIKHQRNGYASAEQSSFVFPAQDSERLQTNSSFNQIVKDAAERADIQETIAQSTLTQNQRQALSTHKEHRSWHRVTVHTLRHSYITLLEDAGVSLPYRQLLANHSNPETTLGYSHSKQSFAQVRDSFDPPR